MPVNEISTIVFKAPAFLRAFSNHTKRPKSSNAVRARGWTVTSSDGYMCSKRGKSLPEQPQNSEPSETPAVQS